jgi:hypothetical protein
VAFRLIKAVSNNQTSVSVKIDPANPNAIPVAPQFLRREFNKIPEQWHSDVASANGRLKQSMLHVPPEDFIFDLFGLGIDNIGLTTESGGYPAQQTWPFIATNLNTNGTILPYWFLVNRTSSYKELKSFIQKAEKIGKGCLPRNTREFYAGLDVLLHTKIDKRDNDTLQSLVDHMKNALAAAEDSRQKLDAKIESKLSSIQSQPLKKALELLYEDSIGFSEALTEICTIPNFITDKEIMYWVNTVLICASETEDVTGLLEVLKTASSTTRTHIRKALRLIDFMTYGPEQLVKEVLHK